MRNGGNNQELREIYFKAKSLFHEGRLPVLATILNVEGSSFRHPGTRLLFGGPAKRFSAGESPLPPDPRTSPDGSPRVLAGPLGAAPPAPQVPRALRTASTTGFKGDSPALNPYVHEGAPGCLGSELGRLAKEVIRDGQARRVSIDLKADDPVLGYGLMCPGRLDILLEPVDDRLLGFLGEAVSLLNSGIAVVTSMTLSQQDGLVNVSKRSVFAHDQYWPADDIRRCFVTRTPVLESFAGTDIFLCPVFPAGTVVVFGADSDGVGLCRLAKDLGLNVFAVDPRPEYLKSARLSGCRRVLGSSAALPASLATHGSLYVLIMNHHFLRDAESLAWALKTRARYIGLVGPAVRTRKLFEELGHELSEGDRGRLFYPAGLDTGSETPREVALSIMAEVLVLKNGRGGDFLKNSVPGKGFSAGGSPLNPVAEAVRRARGTWGAGGAAPRGPASTRGEPSGLVLGSGGKGDSPALNPKAWAA